MQGKLGDIGWLWLLCLTLAAGCEARPLAIPPHPTETSAPATIPAEPLGPIELTWEELEIPLPGGEKFERWMLTPRVLELDGKIVRLSGFVSGTIFSRENLKEFPLLRELECPFGQGGQAYHAVIVELEGKLRTSYTTSPVTVEGTLTIRPHQGPDGTTWAVYHLLGTKVER